jgi:hypothetical protein
MGSSKEANELLGFSCKYSDELGGFFTFSRRPLLRGVRQCKSDNSVK